MQLEVPGLVSHSEVVLGHLRLGRVKSHLVAGQPALVAHHRHAVHSRPVNVIVHITPQVDVLPLIAGLDLTTLLAEAEM